MTNNFKIQLRLVGVAIALTLAFLISGARPAAAQTVTITDTVTTSTVVVATGFEISPPERVFVTASTVNVRFGPGTAYASERKAHQGEPLNFNFLTTGNCPWGRFTDTSGTQRWVAAWLTSFPGATCTAARAAAPATTTISCPTMADLRNMGAIEQVLSENGQTAGVHLTTSRLVNVT
ncbi:SH3 domain-containing protein, partial [Candidatus Woesebacteria bacterium]|nr:SH3 domain-containing protein [Candidatus Woesebacteria bacterium]